jgi:drug/metabolite transporter (DMT)-like permease
MLSGGTIITTAILSYFMLGRKLRKHHVLGCTLALMGFVLVGIASLENQQSADKYSTKGLIIGILMVMASLFTQGTLSNFEEKLLNKYEIDV